MLCFPELVILKLLTRGSGFFKTIPNLSTSKLYFVRYRLLYKIRIMYSGELEVLVYRGMVQDAVPGTAAQSHGSNWDTAHHKTIH
jgi:hypothetical protein